MESMKILTAFVLAAASAAGCATAPGQSPEALRAQAEANIRNWAEPYRAAAAKLIENYGPPDQAFGSVLVWHGKGAWKRTAVWAPDPDLAPGGDFIEQAVAYPVPMRRLQALASFSGKIRVAADGRGFSVRSGSEEESYLLANMAQGVIEGSHNAYIARENFRRALELSAAGKNVPVVYGLQFTPRDEKPLRE